MTDVEFPVDPIDFSTPGDADKVVAIESWNEAGVDMVTVEFTDGEIESMPMTQAEARVKAERCFGPDMITETTKNGISYRWTRLPHSQ
jgi:hypothetical protein